MKKVVMNEDRMEKITSLCKRRGFIFPSSEIYNGMAAIYDFGPYGVELENNIKKEWWKSMVQSRRDIVGLDSAIFMNPTIWKASGHVDGFSDPLVECKSCHARIRVDQLLNDLGVKADEKMTLKEIGAIFEENSNITKCPQCGKSSFTSVRSFNLLVKSNLGNFTDDLSVCPAYLRGETCQGIYVNFKNVLASCRVKIPFGIAQIGKAFRNEITARQFIFRTREFEQMEMQYFVSPDDELIEYEKLRELRWDYYLKLGIDVKNLRWHKHEKLAFYAKEAYDIEYNFPFGFKELEGIHARGEYDLSQHSKFSGQDLSYSDPITLKRFMPHVVECSTGVGRNVLMAICDGYTEENINGENRIVMKFNKKLSPVKVAVFPLLKNKSELVALAEEIFNDLKLDFMCEFDDNGNIGKRYRRQDEIGTPYCVTVDFKTLEDNTVTVRDRDTMKQERIQIASLGSFLSNALE